MPEEAQMLNSPASIARRYGNRGTFLAILVLACLILVPSAVAGDTDGVLRVETASTHLADGVYQLDARFATRLSRGTTDALMSGIPLVFELQINVQLDNPWLLNPVIAELSQRTRLEYHALSRRFLVSNLNTDVQQSFRHLRDALVSIGIVYDLPMLDQRLLKGGKSYSVRLRARLDVESLPTPMRLWAYVSSEWDMRSPWFDLPLLP